VIEQVPMPDLDDEDHAAFWEYCRHGELRIQACERCGRLRFPPRPMCPWCNSLSSTWRPVSGRGSVWSYIVPHPPLLPALTPLAPYNVVVVVLEEDPTLRLVGNLVTSPDGAINEVDPSSITIGEPVRVVFSPVADDLTLPRWVRSSAS
jgi:uncharacterized OB-fold protein